MIDFGKSGLFLSCLSFSARERRFGRRLQAMVLWSLLAMGARGPCYYGRRQYTCPWSSTENAAFNQVETNIFKSNVYDQVEGVLTILSVILHLAGKKVFMKYFLEALIIWNLVYTLNHCHSEKTGLQVKGQNGRSLWKLWNFLKKDKGYYILRSEKTTWEL